MKPSSKAVVSHLDQLEISQQVRKESRNREVHLPPVSIYRWWARRTKAVNSAILEAFSTAFNTSSPLKVADPFAGGGVIPMIALSQGHDVYAQDLSPWVAEGLATALSLPESSQITDGFEKLLPRLEPLIETAYRTKFSDGGKAYISQTFRVAESYCSACSSKATLFPHALVTLLKRKDRKLAQEDKREGFLACPNGHLFRGPVDKRSKCPHCQTITDPAAKYLVNRKHVCRDCGHRESLDKMIQNSGLCWRTILVERSVIGKREICQPTEYERNQAACSSWPEVNSLGVIPQSQETNVLLRHGYREWCDLYPRRQQTVTKKLLDEIENLDIAQSIAQALRFAALGTIEMAGFLSRWDRYYMKSYESMSSHRFNFTTLTVEPNVIGFGVYGRGSFYNRVASAKKASQWLNRNGIDLPHTAPIATTDSSIATPNNPFIVVNGSSDKMLLEDNSVDIILTDPPYHDDVQYHELSLPFRAWAGMALDRFEGEAVAIPHSSQLDGHRSYRYTLTSIFKEFARVLKPSGRLIFSYANREAAAWVNLFAALKSANLVPRGFTIVHSENETEPKKRSKGACHLDLILELSTSAMTTNEQFRPKPVFDTIEEKYLLAVGNAFLQAFSMVNGWEKHLVEKLSSEPFVDCRKKTKEHATNVSSYVPKQTKAAKSPQHSIDIESPANF